MKCPYCGSGEFWPSRKRLPETLLGALLPYRPYRCRSCLKRYLVSVPWYLAFRRLVFPVLVALVLVLTAVIVLTRQGRAPLPEEQAAMAPAAGQASPPAGQVPDATAAAVPAEPAPAAPKAASGQQTAVFRIYLDIAPKAAKDAGAEGAVP
jgi:hypothetical protein